MQIIRKYWPLRTKKRWKATIERIPQTRSLDEPTLAYEYSLDQKDFSHRFEISQMIPGPGKLGLRAKAALAEAEAVFHEYEAARLALFSQVATAFHEYNYLRRAIEVTEEQVSLLTELEQALRARYATGTEGFADLIKIQVERDRINNDLATLVDERAARSAKLAALLNLPAWDPLPWPVMSPSPQTLLAEDALLAMLRDLNPELKSVDAMIQKEETVVRLAKRSRLPDFLVGTGLMIMPGMEGGSDETEAGFMAGVTLPLWQSKYSAEVREASAMLEAAVAERTNMENELKAELKMLLFKARDAERRMRLFDGALLPKVRQSYEVTRQEFATGKADLITLVDAQRTLLEFRLMYERAVADREIALSEIGRYIGPYEFPLVGEKATVPAKQ
ncbi:MAG: TolC family protein [Kiritimatiellia bacterium]